MYRANIASRGINAPLWEEHQLSPLWRFCDIGVINLYDVIVEAPAELEIVLSSCNSCLLITASPPVKRQADDRSLGTDKSAWTRGRTEVTVG